MFYNLINFSEIDENAITSYCAVHDVDKSLNLGDISKIDLDSLPSDIDLITHGSPCTSMSIAGLQEGADEGSGTESSLLWDSVKVIERCLPKFVLWENVKNVLSEKHRHNFDKYLSKMEELGYSNFYKVCNAIEYGIPQARERILCVSIRNDVYRKDTAFTFPEPKDIKKSMEGFLDMDAERKCKSTLRKYFSPEYIKRYPVSKNGLLKVFDGVAQGYFKSSYSQNRIYSILGACPTLTTHSEVNLYELGGKLTSREAWRLMGMGDERYDRAKATGVSDGALMKQAGNGVVSKVPWYIFKELNKTYPEDFKEGMNVISLFSGIGCFEAALEDL